MGRRGRKRQLEVEARYWQLLQSGMGTDLSVHSSEDLDWVAAELNDRPRKRLMFKKPIEQIKPLLLR